MTINEFAQALHTGSQDDLLGSVSAIHLDENVEMVLRNTEEAEPGEALNWSQW